MTIQDQYFTPFYKAMEIQNTYRALPLATNNPVPIDPPIAIICKCLLLSFLANGEVAVIVAATSGSNTLPFPPITPRGVTVKVGSRLKLSITDLVRLICMIVVSS